MLVTALDQNLALRGVVFSWTVHGPPTVSQESLTGVGRGHPSLALTISAARSAPPLTSVSIGPTGGLRFSGARGHVKVAGAGGRRIAFSSRVTRGRLVLTLRAVASRIRVTVSYNLLRASASLAARVRGNHGSALKVNVATTDAGHGANTTAVRIRPRN